MISVRGELSGEISKKSIDFRRNKVLYYEMAIFG